MWTFFEYTNERLRDEWGVPGAYTRRYNRKFLLLDFPIWINLARELVD